MEKVKKMLNGKTRKKAIIIIGITSVVTMVMCIVAKWFYPIDCEDCNNTKVLDE